MSHDEEKQVARGRRGEVSRPRKLISSSVYRQYLLVLPLLREIKNYVKMKLSPDAKQRLQTVLNISKTTFHWGFLPLVLYLGEAMCVLLIFPSFTVHVDFMGDGGLCIVFCAVCW